ncbi:MAG: sugar phosphate nucleotidyltransferase, partial [Gammaproteobacteria bacterium]|nr:sugar phosphate nucleotidyltransferase [Gammaproteobacteria bacterium]
MQAILLAAGRGERMRPITDTTPKPLLKVGERTLIEHQLMRLARAGIKRVAVNLFHLGGMIRDTLGDGSRFGLKIA